MFCGAFEGFSKSWLEVHINSYEFPKFKDLVEFVRR